MALAQSAPLGLTTILRSGRDRILSGTRTVMVDAPVMQRPAMCYLGGPGRASSAPRPAAGCQQPIRTDHQALDQQTDNPRLFRREQLGPERFELLQGLTHVILCQPRQIRSSR